MSKNRFLSIPLNAKGISEYDKGIDNSKDVKVVILSEEEFEELDASGVFEKINVECGLLIDDYESEIIDKKNLQLSQDILKQYTFKSNKLQNAIELAIQKGTLVGLDF